MGHRKFALYDRPEFRNITSPILDALRSTNEDVCLLYEYEHPSELDRVLITPDRGSYETEKGHPPRTIVNVSHGMFWGKQPVDAMAKYDFSRMTYLAASYFELNQLEQAGILGIIDRAVVTGRVDIDKLYLLEQSRGPSSKPVVLYSPTWNECMNGGRAVKGIISVVGEACRRNGWEFRICLHHRLWVDQGLVQFAKKHGAVKPFEADYIDWLSSADVFIGDVGSGMLQFLYTGRPIIAFNSFQWWDGVCFEKHNVMYREIREAVYQFTSTTMIEALIKLCLTEPRKVKAQRECVRERLLKGTFDGKCLARTMAAIYDTAARSGLYGA